MAPRPIPDRLLRWQAIGTRRWLRVSLIALALLGFSIYATWPLATHLHQFLLVTDVFGAAWNVWWVKTAVLHLHNPWWTTQILAPQGSYLSFHTLVPLMGLVALPLTLIVGPGMTVNLLELLLPIAATLGARALARECGLRGMAAWLAGGIYGFSIIVDWRTQYHLNFGFGLPILPLCVLFVLRYDRTDRRRDALLCGAMAGLLLLTEPTLDVFAALAVLLYIAVACVADPRRRRWAHFLGWAVAAALVVGLPQWVMMLRAATNGGYQTDSASLAASQIAGETNVLTMLSPGHVRTFVPGGLEGLAYRHPLGEATPAYGWGALGLALAGLLLVIVRRRWGPQQRRVVIWALFLFLAASVLALGPQLRFATFAHIPLATYRNGQLVSPLMPYTWLTSLPGLSEVRIPARFTMVGMLALAMLAGVGYARLRSVGRVGTLVAALLVAFAVVEAGFPDGGGAKQWVPMTRTALYAPVRADHTRSIVVDVPLGFLSGTVGAGADANMDEPMFRATQTGHPTAEGWLSRITPATVAALTAHPLYGDILAVQSGQQPAASIALARADAQAIDARWLVLWPGAAPTTVPFLSSIGYRPVVTSEGLTLYRLT